MAMNPRTGRKRISKASEIVSKKAEEVLPQSSGRSKISKTDEIEAKVSGRDASAPTGRSRVSKSDEIARKIEAESRPAPAAHEVPAPSARKRPSSKADEISRKIPESGQSAASRRPEPESIPQNVRVNPQIPAHQPSQKKSSGCCLLPFVLGMLSIAGFLSIIF